MDRLACPFCGKLGASFKTRKGMRRATWLMARHTVNNCNAARLATAWAAQTGCGCMVEPDERGVERVMIHSLTCAEHPEHV